MNFAKLPHHSIAKEHLQPDLVAMLKGAARSTQLVNFQNSLDALDIPILLGEGVLAGEALYPAIDGMWYKADNQSSPPKPGIVIAATDGASGENIKGTKVKIVEMSGVSFAIGADVWLSTGSPNITTGINPLVAGNLIQKLGTAITGTSYLPNIQEAEMIL